MNTFTLKGIEYQNRPMPAMVQFHVMRRLSPLFAALVPKNVDGATSDAAPVISVENIVENVAAALSSMSDEDSEYVIDACMSTVQRRRPGDTGWSDVWSKGAKTSRFDDIKTMDMLVICGNVLMGELGPF